MTRNFYGALRDDVIKWKHFPRYWSFVRQIHRSPVNPPHKGQWRGTLMFSLICTWTNVWVNRDAGDLRHCHAHYDVTVMVLCLQTIKSLHFKAWRMSRDGVIESSLDQINLSPVRRYSIIWTNEILFEIQKFLFKKFHLKMSSTKWLAICLGLNTLMFYSWHALISYN